MGGSGRDSMPFPTEELICFSSGRGCGNWEGAGQGGDGGGEEVTDEGGRLAATKPFPVETSFLSPPL